MAHLSTPGPDLGHFSTLEVRPRSKPCELTSRDIAFARNNYTAAPNIAGGFKMLDLAHDPPGGARAVRANLVGWAVSKRGFKVGLETWDGGEMYAAEATWIEHKSGARECHFGQFDTMDSHDASDSHSGGSRSRSSSKSKENDTDANPTKVETTTRPTTTAAAQARPEKAVSKTPTRPLLGRSFSSSHTMQQVDHHRQEQQQQPPPPPLTATMEPVREHDAAGTTQSSCSRDVTFPVMFRQPPRVICWLNRLDLPTDGSRYRLRAACSAISRTRATVRLGTWGDEAARLDGAGMCWIAFPGDKRLVESGTFGVGKWEEGDVEDDDDEENEDMYLSKWTNDDGEKVKGKRGRVKFKRNWFPRVPTVLAALNMLDMGSNADLRIRVIVYEVSRDGFSWRIETWGNSRLYAAGVSWIALGFA